MCYSQICAYFENACTLVAWAVCLQRAPTVCRFFGMGGSTINSATAGQRTEEFVTARALLEKGGTAPGCRPLSEGLYVTLSQAILNRADWFEPAFRVNRSRGRGNTHGF